MIQKVSACCGLLLLVACSQVNPSKWIGESAQKKPSLPSDVRAAAEAVQANPRSSAALDRLYPLIVKVKEQESRAQLYAVTVLGYRLQRNKAQYQLAGKKMEASDPSETYCRLVSSKNLEETCSRCRGKGRWDLQEDCQACNKLGRCRISNCVGGRCVPYSVLSGFGNAVREQIRLGIFNESVIRACSGYSACQHCNGSGKCTSCKGAKVRSKEVPCTCNNGKAINDDRLISEMNTLLTGFLSSDPG